MTSAAAPPPDPRHTISATTTTNGIRLRGVHKSYGPVSAVRGLDLDIGAGETVALLGPNGAGKSTALDMLLGLTDPDSGSISVFGRSPSDAVADGRISAMLQSGEVIREVSVRELVTMVASLYPRARDVEQTLQLAGLAEVADRRTNKLSGGQTQRVRFAIALVAGADLLVLDEPTVAMDVEARHSFWNAMRAIAATGTTIVFATHYLEEADAFADRIILIADGVVVADGSATEISSLVGCTTVRATLPGVAAEALRSLPGVQSAERHGDTVVLSCTDSDAALRQLLARHPDAADLEVRGAGLEEAFLSLTGDARDLRHASDRNASTTPEASR